MKLRVDASAIIAVSNIINRNMVICTVAKECKTLYLQTTINLTLRQNTLNIKNYVLLFEKLLS